MSQRIQVIRIGLGLFEQGGAEVPLISSSAGAGDDKIPSRSETGQSPYDVEGDRFGNDWPQRTYRRPERAIC